jgi:hypothetical protein
MSKIKPMMKSDKLTDHERDQMTVGGSITTLTWMKGKREEAEKLVRLRVETICEKNPWLCGRLVKKGKDLYCDYPESPTPEQVGRVMNATHRLGKKCKEPKNLSSTMDYYSACDTLSGTAMEIRKGSDCIDKDEDLFSVCLVQDAQKEDVFAVVVSMSHVIGDGHTYYHILAMMSSNCEAKSMKFKRREGMETAVHTAMGKEEHEFMHSGSLICNVICSMLCGKKPLIEAYSVDDVRIQKIMDANTVDGEAKMTRNDVLTSAWGVATGARVLLMPLNWRGKNRLGYDNDEAGNYEGALAFGPEDYASPKLVRKSLMSGPPHYKRSVGKPLPKGLGAMRCSLSMCVSWVFDHFSELSIEGCEQIVHMPHSDVNMIPFELAVTFKSTADKISVVFFTRQLKPKDIEEVLPVGDLLLGRV